MADTNSNPIIAWLSETLDRFLSKSPKYFRIWNAILVIIGALPQIPVALTYLDITLPTPISDKVARIITIAAAFGIFMSKLTVKNATIIAADLTNNKLEFTAAKDLNIPSPPKP